MENQHKMIPGYRDWDEGTTGIIAGLKSFLNKDMQERVDMVRQMLAVQRTNIAGGLVEIERRLADGEADQEALAERDKLQAALAQNNEASRWLAMARTDFQTGAMKLIRAVAQPTTEF